MDIAEAELSLWWENHLDEYIEDLRGYVAIPSVAEPGKDGYPFGKPCYEMLVYMKSLMAKYGLDASLIKDVFAKGSIKGSSSSGAIAVACHGDVVPADGEWERSPFDLFLKEGHLVGRGSTDNKGAGIAVLYALRYLKEKHYENLHDLVLLVGSAEEIGMYDVPIAFPDGNGALLTLVPESGFPVAYGEKASLRFEIPIILYSTSILSISAGLGTGVIDRAEAVLSDASAIVPSDGISIEGNKVIAYGKGRHSATPEGGECAFHKLLECLSENGLLDKEPGLDLIRRSFTDFYGTGLGADAEDEESGRLTMVITEVSSSDRTVCVRVNSRLPFSAKPLDVFGIVQKTFSNARLLGSTDGYKIELTSDIMALNEIADSVYGSDRKPYIMAGGTYAREMQPAVAFGMGSPLGNATPPFPQGQGRAHQRNESVQIERMRNGFIIYVRSLVYLDKELN